MTSVVLFVCTGNLCRSPLGEALLRAHLGQAGVTDWRVASAGTHAVVGDPVPEDGRRIAEEHGVDVSDHAARQLQPGMVREARFVLCATRQHVAEALQLAPDVDPARITLMTEASFAYAGWDVPDPYMRSERTWREVYDVLDEATGRWVERHA